MKNAILNHFRGDFAGFYEKYLQKIRRSKGHEYMAQCPFHNDGKPSFSFNTESGRYLCHACGAKGDIFSFYGQLRNLNGDFPAVLKGIANDFGISVEQKPQSKIVKIYDYTDGSGKLLHQTVRFEPKSFKQRRPDGKGGWIWNLQGIEPVLYRLPEVLKAQEILLVEGEKDADSLHALGMVATTAPMGAGKWRPSYNEYLKCKDIALLPDNDTAGQDHMLKVAESLYGTAESIKILNLPDLPDKGDVSDFIESFPDKETAAERLSILIESCPVWEPAKKEASGLDRAILDIDEFLKIEIPERQAYLNPWLKEGSIGLVSGWRGVGKTFFGLGVLQAINQKTSFGPWACEHPVDCLLLDGEMPIQDIKDRAKDLSIDGSRLKIYSDAHAQRQGIRRADLTDKAWRDEMKAYLIKSDIKFWIVDNLASLASGLDENLKHEWDPINQWLLDLRFIGISTMLLHHLGKAGSQRGTSAREDNVDYSITLKSPPNYTPEDGCRFIVNFSKARVRTAELSKIMDIEMKLQENEAGETAWTWGTVKAETKKEILRLLDEGCTQAEVSTALSVDKGYISRIKKQAIRDGLLTEQNKLTQSGFYEVNSD